MAYLEKFSSRTMMVLVSVLSLSLSACATKPERRGPPPDRLGQSAKPQGPAKSSGTFMQPIGALFISMDTNQDKYLSRIELQSGTASEWAQFERKPSAAYFAEWSIANLGSVDAMPTFMSFDRDFNGVIAEGEFASQLERDFDRLDKNKDGRLERSEMLVAFRAQEGRKSDRGGQGGRKQRGQGGRPPSR